MKNILVPIDFSPASRNAFEYAIHLAEDLKGNLTLVHIIPPHPDIGKYPLPDLLHLFDEGRTEDALNHFRAFEKEVRLRLGKEAKVELILESGMPAREIIHLSKSMDFIVMGTQGIESDETKIFGSVTGQVIQKAFCPVWAIPEQATYRPVRNIVFATALEEEEFGLIDPLLELAETFGAKLSFTHIEPSGKPWHQIHFASVEQLYRIHEKQQEIGLYQFTHTDVIAGLQTFVSKTGADVIAILTHQRDLFDRLFSKSFAKEITFYSLTPVLVLHE